MDEHDVGERGVPYGGIGTRFGRLVFPFEDRPLDSSWTAPVEGVARIAIADPRYEFFDLSDFMIMARVLRRPRPSIVLYKHYYTRRYINLDDDGHAYRYGAPRSLAGDGRYVRHRDLWQALDHLELWLLPWMKEGLEHARMGLDWDDRWQLHPSRFDGVA